MIPSPYRILLVEDEASIRRSLRAFLEDAGFEVIGVPSGEAGLAALPECRPDAAIVDMRLPGMDGNTFIRQAHRVDPLLGFLIYTGSVGYAIPPEVQAIGIRPEHVLRKPLHDLAVLATSLRTLLDKRRTP